MGLKTLALASQNRFRNKYSVSYNKKVIRYYSLALVSIVMISKYVAAEEYRSELEALFFLEGQCPEVVVYNQKSACAGMVWQSQYTDGKLGFYSFLEMLIPHQSCSQVGGLSKHILMKIK